MVRIRQDVRLSMKEKQVLVKLSSGYGMTISEYIKYKIFHQNNDLSSGEYNFICPSGERYNYSVVGISQLTQELVKVLLKKLYGDEYPQILEVSLANAKEKLDKQYGYVKIKRGGDE